MKAISVFILIAVFFIPSGQVLAEPHDHDSSCPLAKVVLSGTWGKLKPGLIENERGIRYMETRRSTGQQIAMLILAKEDHGWSVEYQVEDHGSLMIRERLPLKTKDQVKACAQFFTDAHADKEFLDIE